MKTYSKRLGEMKEVPDGEWVRVEVAEQLQELYEAYSRKVARIHSHLIMIDEHECSRAVSLVALRDAKAECDE